MSSNPAPVAAPVLRAHPVVDRPDAGIVAVTEFQTGSPERQQALVDASAAAWAGLDWPQTMLSLTWLTSLDGAKALAYVQWESDAEFPSFARTHRPVLTERLRAALPGVDPVPPTFYRRYRSGCGRLCFAEKGGENPMCVAFAQDREDTLKPVATQPKPKG